MINRKKTGNEEAAARDAVDYREPIHLWFGLTYSSYLVLSRSILQSMPIEWQDKFVALLDEARESFGHLTEPQYRVLAMKGGRFIQDPIPNYDRGRTRLEPRK